MHRLLVLLLLGWTCAAASKPVPPRLMLYSWYRPVAAELLKSRGVAWVLADVMVDRDDVWAAPTSVQTRVPPGTFAMPVLRVNYKPDGEAKPRWTPGQREMIVRMIVEAVELTRANAVQIDFDAPVSARAFYRRLIEEVRKRLGPDVFLSITALASWCDAGSWMTDLPVDEIVPLVFRLGQAGESIQARLSRGEKFGWEGCRSSIGIEGGGWRPPIAPGQRVYVFPDYRGWGDLELLQAVMK